MFFLHILFQLLRPAFVGDLGGCRQLRDLVAGAAFEHLVQLLARRQNVELVGLRDVAFIGFRQRDSGALRRGNGARGEIVGVGVVVFRLLGACQPQIAAGQGVLEFRALRRSFFRAAEAGAGTACQSDHRCRRENDFCVHESVPFPRFLKSTFATGSYRCATASAANECGPGPQSWLTCYTTIPVT